MYILTCIHVYIYIYIYIYIHVYICIYVHHVSPHMKKVPVSILPCIIKSLCAECARATCLGGIRVLCIREQRRVLQF